MTTTAAVHMDSQFTDSQFTSHPASAFLACVQAQPDATFIRRVAGQTEHILRYGQAARLVAARVQEFIEHGLAPRQRILSYEEDPEQCVLLMLAASFAGLAVAPLSPRFSLRAARRLIRTSGAAGVFCHARHASALGDTGLPMFHHVNTAPPGCALSVKEAVATLQSLARERSEHEPYVLFSTSGTTGEPKLAERSVHTVMTPCRWICDALDLGAHGQERLLFCSTMTHAMGQMNLLMCLIVGGQLSCTEGIEGDATLAQVRRLDPTVYYGSPRVIKSLHAQHMALEGDERRRMFSPGMKIVRTGGGSMSQDLFRELQAQGIDVGEAYGSSETSSVAMTPLGGWRPGYIGPPWPGVTVEIAGDGEILVHTPLRMTGYVGEDAAARRARDVVHTGDRGKLGPDGYLGFLGRKKDLFNTPDGTNIHVVAIEDDIERLPWVEQCVLIGHERPFIVGLIVVNDADVWSREPDGYLDETSHGELHARARADLQRVNARREIVERVRRAALFCRPMAPDLYQRVSSGGKVRRNRAAIEAFYATRIAALYGSG